MNGKAENQSQSASESASSERGTANETPIAPENACPHTGLRKVPEFVDGKYTLYPKTPKTTPCLPGRYGNGEHNWGWVSPYRLYCSICGISYATAEKSKTTEDKK